MMKSDPSHPGSYRPDIDGLRAVAVLSVVFTHLGMGVRGGYVGVDVFFVISGFLITRLIRKDLEAGTFSLVEFWERRIRRIFPALAVMALVATVAGWFFLLPNAYSGLGKSLAAVSLGISNFHFWRDQNYFAAAGEDKPLLHTWSLAVEEQFYLFLPLGLALLEWRGKLKYALPVLSVLAVASLIVSIFWLPTQQAAVFYLLPTRAWELFAGALLALGAPRWEAKAGPLPGWLSALGLVLIVVPVVTFSEKTPFPGAAALPPVLGAALLIWAGSGTTPRPVTNRWLSTPLPVAIGKWSYSIYLWHWPLLVLMRAQSIHPLSPLVRTGLFITAIGLGYVSWRWVETPVRQRNWLATRPQLWRTSNAMLAVMAAAGCSIFWSGGLPGRYPPGVVQLLEGAKNDPRTMLEPSVSDVPKCLKRFGAAKGEPRVLVWGDSHAMALLPGLDVEARKQGVVVEAATSPGTHPLVGTFHPDAQKHAFCEAVMAHARSLHPKAVIVVGRWDVGGGTRFRKALILTVQQLLETGAAVYIVNDVPVFPVDVPKALALAKLRRREPFEVKISMDRYREMNHVYFETLPELVRLGAHVLDPLPRLRGQHASTEADFVPYDDGGTLYRDADHLSTRGSMKVAPMFRPLLRQVGASEPANHLPLSPTNRRVGLNGVAGR